MARVFICFAPEDAGFVNLLKRLLRFHHLDTFSNGNTEPPDGIDDAWLDPSILQAEVFLMVLSKNIVGSDWARQELDTFLIGGGKVVGLALDNTEPSLISQSLQPQSILNFHADLAAGFEALFAELGSVFLEVGREGPVRDRRATGDRRRSSTAVRLREGFLKAYKRGQPHEAEYSRIPRSDENRGVLYRTLLEEARRYSYSDRASGLAKGPEQILP